MFKLFARLGLLACLSFAALPVLADTASAPVQPASEPGLSAVQQEAADASRKLAEEEQARAEERQKNIGNNNLFSSQAPQDPRPDEVDLEPKYPVEIVVSDSEMKTLLETHLPLVSYQRKEELDKEQIEFLLEDAPTDAQNILRTEGYFNTQISISPHGKGYRMQVTLGPRTKIDNVSVALLGDILSDDDVGSYYKNALNTWALPVGAPFRQENWSVSKISVLAAVTRKKYPLAKLSKTQAAINPANRLADLNVSVDSRQPIYFGDLIISGTQRYPEKVVRGLAKFQAGDPYDLDKLLDYQQDLENNAHYAGASVQADWDALQNDRVPIKVSVSEVKRQKFEAGLSYDSEYGIGGRIGYDHYNVFNRGYTGSVSFEADRYQTQAAVGISQPRNNKGYFNTANIAYERSSTQKLERDTVSAGIWRVRDRNGIEARYGIEFVAEDTELPEERTKLGRSYATMLTASWKRQNISTPLRPANGYYLRGKVGFTLGPLLSSSTMARVHAGAGYYFTPENKKLGTLVLRGEAGYVYTSSKEASGQVPTVLMFRTGGATSIRGYEYDSIGRTLEGSSTVLPDRALAVASAEYQIPFKNNFAIALFHDMGGVARTFQSMKVRHGTGIGLRWFSPAAPFSFDLAYGHHDRKLRWHISLGTRF